MAGLGRAPDPAVLENLHALQRELVNRHLPTLQEWLRVIVKAGRCKPLLLFIEAKVQLKQ